jgi:CubicO group peptidase (beta-lactamase class C family)
MAATRRRSCSGTRKSPARGPLYFFNSLLAGCLLVGCRPADPPAGILRADSAISAWVTEERVPGAVFLVTRDGETVWREAYGASQLFEYGRGQYTTPDGIERLETPVPMTAETVFDLASVTKVMATTFAVMRLVDDGRIDPAAPVSAYLPDFVGGERGEITVRQLLTHTSGLRQWVPTYYHATQADEAYAYIRDLPLAWPVGAERHYSDLGFMVLGRMVEEVSGRSLDRFVSDEIYTPLGLTRTAFRPRAGGGESAEAFAATSHGNPFERRMVHDPDFGYSIEGDPDAWNGWRERTLIGEVNDGNAFHAFGGVAGHAGLFSTADELATLLELLLGDGEVGGRRLLAPETVRTFLGEVVEGQALGWQLPSYAPEGSFGHTGFTGTFVLAVPAQGLAIVLLTNRQNVGVDEETQYTDVGPLQRAVTGFVTETTAR